MPETNGGRRRLLQQLFALGAAIGSGIDRASAHPAGRGILPLRRQPTVVIDPGHGGIGPSAISSNGVNEKDVVLPIAWILPASWPRLAAIAWC
jgi:N-acetylmuramoyl-L-alanine amidase